MPKKKNLDNVAIIVGERTATFEVGGKIVMNDKETEIRVVRIEITENNSIIIHKSDKKKIHYVNTPFIYDS